MFLKLLNPLGYTFEKEQQEKLQNSGSWSETLDSGGLIFSCSLTKNLESSITHHLAMNGEW